LPCRDADLQNFILSVLVGKNPLVFHNLKLVEFGDGLLAILVAHVYDLADEPHGRVDHVDGVSAIRDKKLALAVVRETPSLLYWLWKL